jgi:GTP pyrophosphokinase
MSSKETIFLKGYAKGKEFTELQKAISFAEKMHEGQTRRDKVTPYVEHPIRVTSLLRSAGIDDDCLLAAAVLHDVIEDCKVTTGMLKDMGFCQETIDIVYIVSKRKSQGVEDYYEIIKLDIKAILLKLADRCHNLSTMAGVFTIAGMEKYIEETEKFILPLCKHARKYHPEYGDVISVLKYHIEDLCHVAKILVETMKKLEVMKNGNRNNGDDSKEGQGKEALKPY